MDPLLSLIIVLLSATPFIEARYAIPLAMNQFGFSATEAFALGMLGNILPVIALLLYLEPISEAFSRWNQRFYHFFSWLFERTRRHSDRFERWGALALIPFVAVPLPITGAWTACAAAFVFGIRFRYAFPAITVGMIVAAMLTTVGITSLRALLEATGVVL